MNRRFSPGNKVQHVTGGPVMAVDGYNEAGMVICSWWDGKAHRQQWFTEESLQLSPERPIRSPVAVVDPGIVRNS